MASHQQGLVLRRIKGFYYVEVDGDVHLCRIKGNLFQNSHYDQKVAVGDEVLVDLEAAEDAGMIYEILPRRSALRRPWREGRATQVLASNLDYLIIVSALKHPPFRYGFVDRFLVAAQQGKLAPVLVLNKSDLDNSGRAEEISALYEGLGYPVLVTSVSENKGLEELRALLQESTSVLAGHSGVGKSSLLKALFPDWKIRIGDVSQGSGRGKHTTTMAEMYPLPQGGYIVDTPGIRALGVADLSLGELDEFFVEFQDYLGGCQFKGCSHLHEPGCLIRDAVEKQEIAETRYRSYCDIYQMPS